MIKSQSLPAKGDKISVLRKMNILVKKKAFEDYVVPHNSATNLSHLLPSIVDPAVTIMENSCDRNAVTKCSHCENMAKNFLYLESLMRNNYNQELKCDLCQSSIKYLQYVNRKILQTFGNFDSIVQAAKAFAINKPTAYGINNNANNKQATRAKGGAFISVQKSHKSLKTASKQKSLKSMKSNKSLKSMKSSKSKRSMSKMKTGAAKKAGGKMVLKRKYRGKTAKLTKQLSKVVRSASQYQNLREMNSKLSTKGKKFKKATKNQSYGIPWGLFKKNLPKRACN